MSGEGEQLVQGWGKSVIGVKTDLTLIVQGSGLKFFFMKYTLAVSAAGTHGIKYLNFN